MTTLFIIILLVNTSGGGAHSSTTTQQFKSENACIIARNRIIEGAGQRNFGSGGSFNILTECIPN